MKSEEVKESSNSFLKAVKKHIGSSPHQNFAVASFSLPLYTKKARFGVLFSTKSIPYRIWDICYASEIRFRHVNLRAKDCRDPDFGLVSKSNGRVFRLLPETAHVYCNTRTGFLLLPG